MLKSTSFSAAPTAVITTPTNNTSLAEPATNINWVDTTITILPNVLIYVIAQLLVVLFRLVREQQQSSQTYQGQLQQQTPSGASTSEADINRELSGRLLNLLYNDLGAANRLLRHAINSNPGRSKSWYLEKVIWDLERDRR